MGHKYAAVSELAMEKAALRKSRELSQEMKEEWSRVSGKKSAKSYEDSKEGGNTSIRWKKIVLQEVRDSGKATVEVDAWDELWKLGGIGNPTKHNIPGLCSGTQTFRKWKYLR